MVCVDVRIAPCTIDLIVDGLTWTAKTATSCNMLSTDSHCFAKCARLLSGCILFHGSETSRIKAHISVSTCAICIVDFGAACALKDAHINSVCLFFCVYVFYA